MKNQTIKLDLFSLVAAALVAVPFTSRAEDKPKTNAAPELAVPPVKKNARLPFHGNVAAVDTAAMTLTVGTLVLNVTSETKIAKDGKPATLSELTVGESVGGSYKKDDAGKLTAAIIHTTEKAPKKEKPAKPEPAK